MSDNTVVPLRHPDTIEDPLTAVLRSGARRLLAQAVEAEAEAFLAGMKGARLPDGRERVVRHGHAPERLVQTGVGHCQLRSAVCHGPQFSDHRGLECGRKIAAHGAATK